MQRTAGCLSQFSEGISLFGEEVIDLPCNAGVESFQTFQHYNSHYLLGEVTVLLVVPQYVFGRPWRPFLGCAGLATHFTGLNRSGPEKCLELTSDKTGSCGQIWN